jgi:flavin reductase (DIM6/NTAB) family NADH-FMN oxidoreductase RutF
VKPTVTDEFKNALRHFPSGVTIVTLRSGDTTHGLTVSAFSSLSAEPPLIAVTINRGNRAHQLLEDEGATFAVNILGHDQQELSDRFAEGSWQVAVTGAPILADALVWLDCTIHDRVDAGSHTIYIGRVRAAGVPRPDEAPLVYWNRGYRQIVEPVDPPLARSA